MDYKDDNLDELLDYIDPAALTYQEWCGVGMALKDSGYDCSLWDSWSQRDTARYHSGECEKKWRSFAGSEHRNNCTHGTGKRLSSPVYAERIQSSQLG